MILKCTNLKYKGSRNIFHIFNYFLKYSTIYIYRYLKAFRQKRGDNLLILLIRYPLYAWLTSIYSYLDLIEFMSCVFSHTLFYLGTWLVCVCRSQVVGYCPLLDVIYHHLHVQEWFGLDESYWEILKLH